MNDKPTGTTEDGKTDKSSGQAVSGQERSRASKKAPVTDINDGLELREKGLPKIKYDVTEIDAFLQTVFWQDLEKHEHILCFQDFYIPRPDDSSSVRHSFPISEATLLRNVRRSTRPAALYFGTAITKICPRDERLYNRKDLFIKQCVICLDDIGTKIPIDKLPDGFKPSYIVESSPGNYQYGIVLAEPITDYQQARILIKLLAEHGYTDAGGLLPTKKVRLPGGVHGKKSADDPLFQTRLNELNDRRYTPDEIVQIFNLGTSWDDIQNDPLHVERQMPRGGIVAFSPIRPELSSTADTIDIVTEALHFNNLIVSMEERYHKIICPWCDGHSKGTDDYAGYSGLGMGSTEQERNTRHFHCFHEHCVTNKTADFLAWVKSRWDIEVPIHDPAADLISKCIYDAANHLVHDVSKPLRPAPRRMESFKEQYTKPVRIDRVNKKGEILEPKYTTLAKLWSLNPARIVVDGVTFDPSTRAKIVEENGVLKVNRFGMPDYGEGPYDQNEVDFFLEYLEYLLPIKDQRDTFIQILAAKMQDGSFRGWGLLMVAHQQRTGRGTLEAMLKELYDPLNCFNVPLAQLVGDDPFNEWQGGLWAFTSEAEAALDAKSFYKTYNTLKDRVDTSVKDITINHKYGMKENRPCYTTHLLFSNYSLGAALEAGDKRFYVMKNTDEPRGGEYFTKVHAWKNRRGADGRPVFCKHVARYLKTIDVDWERLNGQAEETREKQLMIDATRSAFDVASVAFFDALEEPIFTYSQFYEVLFHNAEIAAKLNLSDNGKRFLRHRVKEITRPMNNFRVRVEGKASSRETVLIYNRGAKTPTINGLLQGKEPTIQQRFWARDSLRRFDLAKVCEAVKTALIENGF